MERPNQGVLRLATRSPNRFLVIRSETRPTIPIVAALILIALFLVPLPLAIRLAVLAGLALTVILHLRGPRADLWLERPPRESEAPVPARLETSGIDADRVFLRISELSGSTMRTIETLEISIEKHGGTSVARFAIPPIDAKVATVIVTAVMGRRVYRFKVR